MSEAWRLWEGQVLDSRLPLRQYLGGNGSSAVFRTEYGQPEPKIAAVKLIAVDPDKAGVEQDHAESGAGLGHAGLIATSQVGVCPHDGQSLIYVVMEYAPENLAQVVSERPLTAAETREVLTTVLGALSYLHGEGFVHGHLKPANIMAVNDQIKISSDGLRRLGDTIETPGNASPYDPPERAYGVISPAGDVWSLAMTMVEVLTQRLPVRDRTGHNQLLLPESLASPFVEIARNCLQEDPQRRWTAGRVASWLEQQSSPPLIAAPIEAPAAEPKHRLVLGVTAAAVGLAAVLFGSTLLRREPLSEQAPAKETPLRPRLGPDTAKPAIAQLEKEENNPSDRVSPFVPQARKHEASGLEPETVSPSAPGSVVRRVVPVVSSRARNTIQGRVRVGVGLHVDARGKVVRARLVSPATSHYFAALALQAARGWRFTPPRVEGRDVPSFWTLQFEFRRSGTQVYPMRVAGSLTARRR
jgi:TonB family protein